MNQPSGSLIFLCILAILLIPVIKSIVRRVRCSRLGRAIALQEGFEKAKILMDIDGRSAIGFDAAGRRLCLVGGNWIHTETFEASDVICSEIYVDGQPETRTVRSSQAVGAVVGGLLLGPLGFVVGGLSGKKRARQKVASIELRLTVNDTDNPLHDVRLLARELDERSRDFKALMTRAREWHAYVEVLIKHADAADRLAASVN